MSKTQPKSLALVVGAAVAAGSLFSMQAMAHGYMQEAGKTKASASEGKCGEGKCGAGMMAGKAKPVSDTSANIASHEGKCGMTKMDTDHDGRLSRAEFEAAHKGSKETFASHDLDGDGFISQAEMDKHHATMKDGEGKCGEGKCGEGQCGGKM